MLIQTEISDIADIMARFIEAKGITFERGNPQPFFTKLGFMHDGFTLPLMSQQHRATVVRLKNLYGLWNTIVDDEIDRDGRRDHLDASLRLLLHRSRGEAAPVSDSKAALTLDELLSLLSAELPRKNAPLEAFYFDLWDLMNGFSYEYCINKLGRVANSVEYGKYSTMTASIKHYLDLDCLFAAQEVSPSDYRHLRVGYEHLGLAIKFASDIGTLKRELMDEDNLNLVRILALEAGLSGAGVQQKLEDEAQYESFREQLRPHVEKVRQLAQEKLAAADAAFTGLSSVDARPVFKAVTRLVETYFKSDPYFQEK
jgi:hypothetical protein